MGNAKNKKYPKKETTSAAGAASSSSSSAPDMTTTTTRQSPAAQRLAAAEAAFEKDGMNFGRLVAEANLAEFMAAAAQHPVVQQPQQDDRKKKTCTTVKTTDIMFGRGVKAASHAGNVLFRHIVVANQDYYQSLAPDKDQQKRAIDVMMAHFEGTLGTRFLEAVTEGKYQTVGYDRIYDKFMNLFRETREKWCSAITTHAQVVHKQDAAAKSPSFKKKAIGRSPPSSSAKAAAPDSSSPESSRRSSARSRVRTEKAISNNTIDVVAAPSNFKEPNIQDPEMSLSDVEEDDFGAHFSKASRRERARLDRNRDLESQPVVTPELESVRKILEDDGISVERFLFEARIERLRRKYRPSKLSTQEWDPNDPPTFSSLAPCDVLLGRGAIVQAHSGNVLMRHVMGINHDYYQSLKRPEKDPAADALIAYFELKGIRFVEEHKGTYQAVSYPRVVAKFQSCIRTGITAFQRHRCLSEDAFEQEPEVPPSPPTAREARHSMKAAIEAMAFDPSAPLAPPRKVTVPVDPCPIAQGEEMYEAVQELERIGVNLYDFLSGSKLEDLANKATFQYSQLSKVDRADDFELNEYKEAHPLDIIFGRGNTWNRHAGNWLFRQVVGLNQDFYRDGISRIEKPIAADALVGRFETIGVRFLEVLDDSTFVEVEYRRVVEKFKQGLREKILLKTLIPMSTAMLLSSKYASKGSSKQKADAKSANQNRKTTAKKKREHAEVESFSDESDKPRYQKVSKVTPEGPKLSLNVDVAPKPVKKRKNSDYIVKKNPEDFLRISHFVMNFEEDEEVDEEELGRVLHTIRYAIRTSTPTISRTVIPKAHFGSVHARRTPADKEVEKLMQIYRPSHLSRIGTGTKTPCPVFFQDW